PDVAATLDLERAKELEASGKNAEALAQYSAIAVNPRYQNTVATLEAGRRAAQLNQDRNKSTAVSTEQTVKAEHDAHVLLTASRNLLLNKMNDAAGKKLREILDTYPETSSAKEAKKLLADIK